MLRALPEDWLMLEFGSYMRMVVTLSLKGGVGATGAF